MTVLATPAGALTIAVLVAGVSETFLPVGDKLIFWTTVPGVAASVTVTWPPATLIAALQPPPTTLTVPPAPVWSAHVKLNERPVMPLAADLQISIVPLAAARAGSWLARPPAAVPTTMGSIQIARSLRFAPRSLMDRPLRLAIQPWLCGLIAAILCGSGAGSHRCPVLN